MTEASIAERAGETIYDLLRTWADRTPVAVALAAPGRASVTYRKLLEQIDSTIVFLREIRIRSNDRIAIVLPNGVEFAALVLAVSCAAISVPLNPEYGDNELENYLHDNGIKALVVRSGAHSAAVSVAQNHGIPVIELISPPNTSSGLFTLRGSAPVMPGRQQPLEPDNVALILHTSGTTSKPKRVPLTHRNLCASAYSIRATLGLTSADRSLGVMPLFHIHGLVGGLLSSLAAGASFAATPNSDPSCFFDWMKVLRPTWYTAVPTFHQAILRYARERGKTVETGSLRLIRSSSASLPPKTIEELEKAFNVPVIEAYGMTEASHQITSNPLPPRERKVGSVGVPTETQVAIMDETGNLLSGSRNGEVVIRGANVTAGYEPHEAKDKSFNNGWFRTGDLGYFDSCGYLFLTGRQKEIINRGGEKIAPREIDEALLGHPDVLQAVAFAIPHPSLGEDIAAVVVVRDPTRSTETSLRDYLMSRLVDFKVPARVLIVDEIPKSSTGKIPRASLAKTFAQRLQAEFIAPGTNLEQLIANIYGDVLEVPQVGLNDNFFALGGDSLRAMQVISRVRSLFSINLPIATLFLKTTVAQLAEEIAESVQTLEPISRDTVCAELRKSALNECFAAQPDQGTSKH
jgi:acyl-CoA synthetase (AMP-forming)/AMP-acid ligase II/acyl carrier protein